MRTRDFIAPNQDVEYDVGFGRGRHNGDAPLKFSVPHVVNSSDKVFQ
jgi:hypothetical protein